MSQVDFLSLEHLRKAADAIQRHLCCYKNKSFCDCKFGADSIGSQGEQGNGCPEMRVIEAILFKMTPAELKKIYSRKIRVKKTKP